MLLLLTVPVAMGMMPPAAVLPASLQVFSEAHIVPGTTLATSTAPLPAHLLVSSAAPLPRAIGPVLFHPTTSNVLRTCPISASGLSSTGAVQQASPLLVPGGLFLGDSLAPLPGKLVKKISNLQYIKTVDLLPEAWLLEEAEPTPSFKWKRGPVMDILQWVQCFASLASVLATVYPMKVLEFMAYLSTIVRCHKPRLHVAFKPVCNHFRLNHVSPFTHKPLSEAI